VPVMRDEKASGLVEKIVWMLAFGVDASALKEVFGVRKTTIRTWLCRSGMQGWKLHKRFMSNLKRVYHRFVWLPRSISGDRGSQIGK